MKLKITNKNKQWILSPEKVPDNSNFVVIEFFIDPTEDGETIYAELFETIIVPVSLYKNLYRQLFRDKKIRALNGHQIENITATEFYAALKSRHEKYDKAIGYHTFF